MKLTDMWNKMKLKSKLLAASTFVTCSILFIASVVFIVSEVVSLRSSLKNDLMSYAQTTSMNLSAALAFEDQASAMETLEALRFVPAIVGAAIYDRDGTIVTSFVRDENITIPQRPAQIGYYSGIDHIYLIDSIVLDGEVIGSIYIHAELRSFYVRVVRYVLTLLAIMLFAFGVSYSLFTKLHRIITDPVTDLTDLMRTVSEKQDYSIRADVSGNDEFAYLAKGFNEMFDRIDQRDRELAHHRTHLEELVNKRTAALTDSNTRLENELAERTRIEAELAQSEHRYRTIFETTGNPSAIISGDGIVLMVNTAFEKVSGYRREEVEGILNWRTFVFREDVDKIENYRATWNPTSESGPLEYECRLINKEEDVLYVLVTSSVIPETDRTVTSMLDMTERKRLEEQLIQSQKMEAIGQLAGGVAHDFNNILTSIIGYGNLIQLKMSDNEKLMQYVNPLLGSADKAKHLTQALLAFSRKQIIAPKPVDLNSVIENVKSFVIRLIGEDIEMNVNLSSKDLIVFADAGQLDQVLMNFATNARDAMPSGGTFTIETDIVNIDEAFCRKHGYGKKGDYALIRVSDTGTGISKKNLDHIFEPFFTTKEVGKGTGLGLSIVYGIVKQNNGYINVYSEPGHGTIFKIYMPLMSLEPEKKKAEASSKPRGGNEMVLLAEDDIGTRGIIKTLLQEYGYNVIEAVDGEDAVEKYHECSERISLLIVDVIMPKKNGKAVFDEIRKDHPDVRALFVSGYTADIIHKRGLIEPDLHFMEKPIIANQFLTKVRSLLDMNR